jgi:hypothetical protein
MTKIKKLYKGEYSSHIGPNLKSAKSSSDAMELVIAQLVKDGGIPDIQFTLDGRYQITCEKFPTFKATFNHRKVQS